MTALLKLGRDAEMGPTIIGNLVGYRIEMTAIEAAAPYLPALKSALPDAEFAAPDALPPGPSLTQLLVAEKRLGPIWMIQELKRAEETGPPDDLVSGGLLSFVDFQPPQGSGNYRCAQSVTNRVSYT